jgi:hypothetical protein
MKQNPTTLVLAATLLSFSCIALNAYEPEPETPPAPQPQPATIEQLEASARNAATVPDEQAAIAALAQQPGLGLHYYKNIKSLGDLDTATADAEMLRLFKFLAKVQSDEIVMAVAEFLTQDTRPPRVVNDPNFVPTDEAAAEALGQMQLPDAPVEKPVEEYTAEDVAAWRDWLEEL